MSDIKTEYLTGRDAAGNLSTTIKLTPITSTEPMATLDSQGRLTVYGKPDPVPLTLDETMAVEALAGVLRLRERGVPPLHQAEVRQRLEAIYDGAARRAVEPPSSAAP